MKEFRGFLATFKAVIGQCHRLLCRGHYRKQLPFDRRGIKMWEEISEKNTTETHNRQERKVGKRDPHTKAFKRDRYTGQVYGGWGKIRWEARQRRQCGVLNRRNVLTSKSLTLHFSRNKSHLTWQETIDLSCTHKWNWKSAPPVQISDKSHYSNIWWHCKWVLWQHLHNWTKSIRVTERGWA